MWWSCLLELLVELWWNYASGANYTQQWAPMCLHFSSTHTKCELALHLTLINCSNVRDADHHFDRIRIQASYKSALLALSASYSCTVLAPSASYNCTVLAPSESCNCTVLAASASYNSAILAPCASYNCTVLAQSASYYYTVLSLSASYNSSVLAFSANYNCTALAPSESYTHPRSLASAGRCSSSSSCRRSSWVQRNT